GIYTNNTPSGAFRSFGALQTAFATESHLDICAERLGLDPFLIRRINAMRDGAMTHTKAKLGSVSLTRTLDALEKASGWDTGGPTSRGATRSDLNRPDIRPPCALGARLAAAEKQEAAERSEEHTSELQSLTNLVCRLLLEKKKNKQRR